MNIITKYLHRFNRKEFIESIIKESMPIYRISVAPTVPHSDQLISYSYLKYKVNLYNTIIINEKLQQSGAKDMGKEGCSREKKNTTPSFDNEKTKRNNNESEKLLLPSNMDSIKLANINTWNSLDDFTVSNNEITKIVYRRGWEIVKYIYPKETYIIIEDNNSMEINIYYLNSISEITHHYKIKGASYADFKFHYDKSHTIKVSYCCWYRQFFDILANSSIGYIRKPHKCLPYKCKCCCKKYVTHLINCPKSSTEAFLYQTKKPSSMINEKSVSNVFTLYIKELGSVRSCQNNVKIKELHKIPETKNTPIWSILQENEGRIQSVTTNPYLEPSKSLNLIEKALNYSPSIVLTNNYSTTNKSDYLKCVFIEINNSKTHTLEQYKIGPDGEIESFYIKHFNILESYNRKEIFTLNNDEEYDNIPTDVCCWYTRNTFLDQLGKIKLLPSSLKFMRSPVEYCRVKCSSCQSLLESKYKLNRQIDLSLPEYVFHTSEYMDKILDLQINFTTTAYIEKEIVKNVMDKKKTLAEKTNQTINTTSVARHKKKTQETPQSNTSVYPQLSTSNTVNVITKQLLVDPVSGAESTEVKMFVNNILEKFKGVQLILNTDGNILAQFGLSENNLKSEEIQMLTQIITQAQNELDALGPQMGNTDLNLCNLPGISKIIANICKLQEKTKQQKVLVQENDDISTKDDCVLDDRSKVSEEENIPVISNPSTLTNNNFYNKVFSTLMRRKRKHYLNAFEQFLKLKQDTFSPIIENVYSIVSVENTQATKRKAMFGEDISKRIKIGSTSNVLELLKTQSNSKSQISDNIETNCISNNQNLLIPDSSNSNEPVSLISTKVDDLNEESIDPLQYTNKNVDFKDNKHNIKVRNQSYDPETNVDIKDVPGPSKSTYMPQPFTITHNPILHNLLKRSTSTVKLKNTQASMANAPYSNIMTQPEIPVFPESSLEMAINLHDNLFKVKSTKEDVI